MMASLRARLLAAVLALTACGLLLAGGITYIEQRSFQYYRVDQQLRPRSCRSAAALERMAGGGDSEPGRDGPDHGRGPAAVRTSASRPGPTARSATRAAR